MQINTQIYTIKEDDYSKKIKDLAEEIENLKKNSPELNYIDCTVEVCEKYNIELETVKKILPKTIKEKIKKHTNIYSFLIFFEK